MRHGGGDVVDDGRSGGLVRVVDVACGGQIGEIVPTVAPQILRLLFASRCVSEIRGNASSGGPHHSFPRKR